MTQFQIYGGTVRLPTGSVANDTIAVTSGDEIDADKLQHVYTQTTDFGTVLTTTPTNSHKIVWVAPTSGVIRNFGALLYDTGSNTDIDFDLLVDGVSALSSVLTLTHGTANNVLQLGSIGTPTFVAGATLSIQMTVTQSTGAQGPFAQVEVECRAS